jgi:hypothetical protein
MLITMIISSLLLIASCSVEAADVTITDTIDDVSSVDYYTGETVVVTSNPEINVNNLDITKVTYTQNGNQATLVLQVKGNIENRGGIIDLYSADIFDSLNFVEYDFQLATLEGETEELYMISYSNYTGQLDNGIDTINLTSSDFSVEGDTLTITFSLNSATEVYEELTVTSMFMKVNLRSSKHTHKTSAQSESPSNSTGASHRSPDNLHIRTAGSSAMEHHQQN